MDYQHYTKEFIESVSYIQGFRSLDSINRFSRGETRLLAALHYSGDKMQAKELARIAGISTARVTAILNTEEKKNYIKREAINGDRRKINIILTEAGALEYQKRRQELHSRLASYFAFLGEDDTKHLLHILNRTKEFLETNRRENLRE